MKLLLDTHTFIWLDTEPERLSDPALAACQDPATELILSVVSAWEMQIKHPLGRLELAISIREMVETQTRDNGMRVLPVNAEHVYTLDRLPAIHKDPFDRLLAAQAVTESAVLVTADQLLRGYPVETLWWASCRVSLRSTQPTMLQPGQAGLRRPAGALALLQRPRPCRAGGSPQRRTRHSD